MKWRDDPYRDIKLSILDSLVYGLTPDHASKINLKVVHDAIDNLFIELLNSTEEKSP